EKRAGVKLPRSDSGDAGQSTNQRRRVPVCRRTITQLSASIVAPAGNSAVRAHGAGMAMTGSDAHGADAAGNTGNGNWDMTFGVGAIAQLSIRVEAPTSRASVRQQRAGVRITCHDADCAL